VNGRTAALFGGVWGLAASGALLGIRVVGARPGPLDPLEETAFAVVHVGPFILALAALWFRSPEARAGAWWGTGVLAILLSVTSLAGVTLILLPAGVALMVAGGRAVGGSGARIVVIALIVVVAGAAAYLAPFLSTERECWARVQSGGRVVWRPADDVPGIRVGQGSIGFDGSSGARSVTCTENTTSSVEAALMLGAWTALGVGLAATGRRPSGPPAEAVA
jgi:hypothetical protein